MRKLRPYLSNPGQTPLRFPLWFTVAILAAMALYVYGWRLMWFMTDDAYIAFRYVSNSFYGLGYTWNPPPFAPVEGYTSFLWVVLLEAVWRVTGIEPPGSANSIALLFALGTMAYTALIGLRMRLPLWAEGRARLLLVCIVLFASATNRTFLAWGSSGLETSMFNFLMTAWVYHMLYPPSGGTRRLLVLSSFACLTYFTRPDGALAVIATVCIAGAGIAIKSLKIRDLSGLLPLITIPVHLAWRLSYYGAWLPNTYYAKKVASWPESGLRYMASFMLEYAFWLWIPLAACTALKLIKQTGKSGKLKLNLPMLIASATVAAHIGYYTIAIGGDHFEYRVYSYLIPLMFLLSMKLCTTCAGGARGAIIAMTLLAMMSWPIQWSHYALSHDLDTRRETHRMHVPLAPEFPAPLKEYASMFDSAQKWLSEHYVGLRHQEHKVYMRFLIDKYSSVGLTRTSGSRIPWEPAHPVTHQRNVGYLGWVLPNVAIIDTAGLNDYVTARTPTSAGTRLMAHERMSPEGYINCFRPDILINSVPRSEELTDRDIVDCELKWRKWADSIPR